MSRRMYSAPSSPSQMDSGLVKRASKKWSRQEQDYLLSALELQNKERINWADVAKGLPGRTGKQCREKWKNDLRPDICKDPWVDREEYILTRLHSEVGNQWAEIAKYLPGRSENSIKNHWNASLRSKAESKGKTLLGAYGRIVLEQQGTTSPEIFEQACQLYIEIHGPDSLEEISVGDDFFQQRVISRAASAASGGTQGNGAGTVTSSPVRIKIGGVKRRASRAGSRKKGRSSAAYDSDDTSEEDADDYEEEEEEKPAKSRRPSGAASLSRRNSSGLPPLPPAHNSFHGFNMLYGGDASATIRITSQASSLLPPKGSSSVPFGPFGSDPFLAFASSFPQVLYDPHQGMQSFQQQQQQAQWQLGMQHIHGSHAIPSMPTEAQATLPMNAADDLDNWAEFDFAFLHEMAGAEAANARASTAPVNPSSGAPSATRCNPRTLAAPSSVPSAYPPVNAQSSLPPSSAAPLSSMKPLSAIRVSTQEGKRLSPNGVIPFPGVASTPFKLLTSPGDAFAPGLHPPSTGAGKFDIEALNFFSSLIADAPHPCGLNLAESSPFAQAAPASAVRGPTPARAFFSPPQFHLTSTVKELPRAASPDLSGLPPGSPISEGAGL